MNELDRTLTGTFPMGVTTTDGRRINALGNCRFPLPLLAMPPEHPDGIGHEGAEMVGQIVALCFLTEARRSTVLLTCRLNEGFAVEPYRGWYIGPDLDGLHVEWTGLVASVRGMLIGATLQQRPAWPNQLTVILPDELGAPR